MICNLKKSLIVLAAMAAPLTLTAQASANNGVDQQALNQFTQSIRDTLSTYDALDQGNIVTAKSKLDQAIRNLDSAMVKDPSLSLSQKSGNTISNDLKRVKAKLSSGDKFQAKSELTNVLSSAGIITGS